jgi:hypothetical protein
MCMVSSVGRRFPQSFFSHDDNVPGPGFRDYFQIGKVAVFHMAWRRFLQPAGLGAR